MRKLVIPEGTKHLSIDFLRENSDFSILVLPESVNRIDESCFIVMPGLAEIHMMHKKPEDICELEYGTYADVPSGFATDGSNPENVADGYTGAEFNFEYTQLYVPEESVELYRNHPAFDGFIILPEYMENPMEEDFGPYDIRTLKKQHDEGIKHDFFFFWGHTPQGNDVDRSCLSQWYPCSFVVDDITYNCAEQYMMAEKAGLFGDWYTRDKILSSSDPVKIKALGRKVRNFIPVIWNAFCYDIVFIGNKAKFSQNPDLKHFLLGTKGKYLVEASPYDQIWGIGMKAGRDAMNPHNWKGTNKLGFALTEVRDSLIKEMPTLGDCDNYMPEPVKTDEKEDTGVAIIFAGGSASGKSTLIREMGEGFVVLSTDTYGEDQIEVHNNAKGYAVTNPERLSEAEQVVRDGMHSRFPNKYLLNQVQNLVLDFNSPTVSSSSVSALLSIGAHKYKEKFFKSKIDACAQDGMNNLILDMTGKEREVKLYTQYLKEKGYKIYLYWVIASRSQALIWNAMRPRCMKISGVHSGHIGPNSYLLDAIQDSRSKDWDKVVLKFNSTDDIRRPFGTDEPKEVTLEKNGDRFIVGETLQKRIVSILGPLEADAYISQDWIKKFFLRYRMMRSVSKSFNVQCPQITDLIVSLLERDKKTNELNIRQFYSSLNIKEPELPKRPFECYDVAIPVRQQFLSDSEYEEACRLYPEQKKAHERSLNEWAEYEKAFDYSYSTMSKSQTTPDMGQKESTHLTYDYDFKKIPSSKYSKHVQELDKAIHDVETLDVSKLVAFFEQVKADGSTICFYGAGGAMSPVTFASQLALSTGIVALSLTPLEVLTLPKATILKMRFVALTASGKPADMQAATEHLLKIAPERVFCITTSDFDHKDRWGRLDNHVGILMRQYAPNNAVCVNLEIHSDGYVGTRKHVCTALIIYRALYPEVSNLAELLLQPLQKPFELRMPNGMNVEDISDIHILYGALGHAAANDLEGRLLECGLMPAMSTDFKNFTHGRHTYINTRPTSTILFLIAPQDEKFVAKMLKTIPKERPAIFIRTNREDLLGALQLMICTFYLGIDLGLAKGVDMHSPGTPDWGVKLWGMKLSDCYDI